MNYSEIKKRMEAQGIAFTDPVSEAEVDRIEAAYGITFPKALREFYRQGIPFSNNEYDFPAWSDFSEENVRKIKERIDAPCVRLLHDVQNGYWIALWGSRPDTAEKAAGQVFALADSAPKLIPVFGHRYIPLIDGLDDPPVISAAGRDIVYYGSDLSDYLEREFADKTGAFEVFAEIPFWGEIINANRAEFAGKMPMRTVFSTSKDRDKLSSADGFAHLIEIARADLRKVTPEQHTEAVAFETASGNLYHTVIRNALAEDLPDEKALLERMKAQKDTEIRKIVCLWAGEQLDMPSYDFRMLLCEMDERNKEAVMLLRGKDCFIKTTVYQTIHY